MPVELVSHVVVHDQRSANDAADGSGAVTPTSDVKTITSTVKETLPSGKIANGIVTLVVDDIAKTQTPATNITTNPSGGLDEDDLDGYDTFISSLAGLVDSLKTNYPTT